MSGRFAVRLALMLCVVTPTAVRAQTVCRPTDADAQQLVRYMRRYATASRGDDKAVRDSLRIPLVTAGQVSLVTSENTCEKARDAFNAAANRTAAVAPSGRVYVVAMGKTYAVLDPVYRYDANSFGTIVILDSEFKLLNRFR